MTPFILKVSLIYRSKLNIKKNLLKKKKKEITLKEKSLKKI